MRPAPDALDAIVQRVRSLPLSTDGAIEQIVAACDSATATLPEVAQLVAREPALAAIVMRQANSAYYGFGRRVDTLADACVLLGIASIRTLALTNAALRFLAVDRDGLTRIRRDLLAHSVAVGIAARAVARRGGAHPERAFLCGLVHELGTIAMSRVAKPEFLHVFVTARREGRRFEAVEREVLGFDHAALGARLAEAWRFPPGVCDAVLNQHDPAGARLERGLAEALHCADWLAARMAIGTVPFEQPDWPERRAADAFGLSPLSLEEIECDVRAGVAAWRMAA